MKRWAIGLILLLGVLCVVGIGFAYVKMQKPIVLELGMFTGSNWGVASEDSYKIVDRAIAKFEASHPGVRVHYYSGIRKVDYSEWYAEQVLLGKAPDCAMILREDFNQLAAIGALKDLGPLLTVKKEDFFASSYRAGQYKGKQYGIPYEVNPMVMAVNKTLLEKKNIKIPNYDWTWNDFYSICRSITEDVDGDGVIDTFGMCDYGWKEAFASTGGSLFDSEGRHSFFADQKVSDSVRFMQRFWELNQGQKLTQDDFDMGKVAFMPLSFAEYKTYTSYPYKINKYMDYQCGILTMPSGGGGDPISEVNVLLMGISAKTKHERLAVELLEMFTHDEEIQMDIYRYSQGASPLEKVTASEEIPKILETKMENNDKQFNGQLLYDVLSNGVTFPKFRKYNECMALADSAINSII
ncbi:MAG: extracellular solute-binding protein, partial [Sphaerochaetaceae bacterium]